MKGNTNNNLLFPPPLSQTFTQPRLFRNNTMQELLRVLQQRLHSQHSVISVWLVSSYIAGVTLVTFCVIERGSNLFEQTFLFIQSFLCLSANMSCSVRIILKNISVLLSQYPAFILRVSQTVQFPVMNSTDKIQTRKSFVVFLFYWLSGIMGLQEVSLCCFQLFNVPFLKFSFLTTAFLIFLFKMTFDC